MKKTVFFFCMCLMVTFCTNQLSAQITAPAPSPKQVIKQKVGLTDVTIEYSRPGVKGRDIFSAKGLVPFGSMWRTGANQATKFTFSDDVTVGGKALKAGSYAVFTKPGATSWDVMFFDHHSASSGAYGDKTPAAKFSTAPIKFPEGIHIETFTIHVGEVGMDKATIEFLWDDTMVPFSLGVEVDKKVMAQIDRTLNGPSPNDYYAAASYYLAAGKDLDKALTWVQKVTKGENPRYWQLRKEAEILAALGRYKDAIAIAKKSNMASDNNEGVVATNQMMIDKWMKM